MDVTIDGIDVTVLQVDERATDNVSIIVSDSIDEHTVRIVVVVNGQLAVIHVGQCELTCVLWETTTLDRLEVVFCPVKDTVVNDNLLDGVECIFAIKTIPRRSINESFCVERVQIIIDSLVRGRKYSIFSTCGYQLKHTGGRTLADVHVLHQLNVLAVGSVVSRQVTGNRIFLEGETVRHIHLFLTTIDET